MLHTKELYRYIWDLSERPNKISDVIMPKRFKKMFNTLIKQDDIGNLLFSGPQGIGKTTIAYCLAEQMNRDTYCINCSKDRGIDTIRDKISDFVRYESLEGNKKLVIMDEMDQMTHDARKAFKAELEKFLAAADFILITNYKNVIDKKLLSRLKEVDFIFSKNEQKEMILEFYPILIDLIKRKGFKVDQLATQKLIKKYFPDIRKIINEAQKICTFDGSLSIEGVERNINTDFDKYIEAIKTGNWNNMREFVANLPYDPNEFYNEMFKEINKIINLKSIPQVIDLLHKYNYEGSICSDGTLALVTFSLNLIKLQSQKNIFI